GGERSYAAAMVGERTPSTGWASGGDVYGVGRDWGDTDFAASGGGGRLGGDRCGAEDVNSAWTVLVGHWIRELVDLAGRHSASIWSFAAVGVLVARCVRSAAVGARNRYCRRVCGASGVWGLRQELGLANAYLPQPFDSGGCGSQPILRRISKR